MIRAVDAATQSADTHQADPNAKKTIPAGVWLIGSLIFLFGVVLLIAGGEIHALSEYDRSLFAHFGTAFTLVGPLFVIERFMSRRIDVVARSAAAAMSSADVARDTAQMALTQVGDLSARVQARLDDLRAEDQELRDRAASGAQQSDLVALYDRAARNRSIDRLGLRIPAPNLLDLWLRVRAVHRAPEGTPVDLVELQFEDGRLDIVGDSVVWSPSEPVEDVFVRVAAGLQTGLWRGDSQYDPEAILSAIANALGQIIDLRAGPTGDPRTRQIASLVNDDWAVTREGLDSLRSADVYADHHELVGETSPAFQRLEREVKRRGWDEAEFRAAFAEAEHVHGAFKRQSPGQNPFSPTTPHRRS
jgi:hypothetical protein